MKSLPHNSDLLGVAPRVIWFEPPEQALANPVRFLAYLMTYGTLEDIQVVRRHLGLEDFREALEHAPRGSSTRAPGRTGMPCSAAIPRRRCHSGSFLRKATPKPQARSAFGLTGLGAT
jgi:hypothetical protein